MIYLIIFSFLASGLFIVSSEALGLPPISTVKGVKTAVKNQQSLPDTILTVVVMPSYPVIVIFVSPTASALITPRSLTVATFGSALSYIRVFLVASSGVKSTPTLLVSPTARVISSFLALIAVGITSSATLTVT